MTTTTNITWDALLALSEDAERGVAVPAEACDALGEEIVRCEVLQNGSLYRQLLCLRLFEQSDAWAGWKTLEAWMSVKLGLSYKTANERLRVARSLAWLPKIDLAFREGRLSYTKVRALHDVATPENEETLLELALWASGEQLRRLLAPLRAAAKRGKSSQEAREQERKIHFVEHPDEDLVELRATLLPEEAAVVRKALEVAFELELKTQRSRPGPDSAAAESDSTAVGAPNSAAAESSADAPAPVEAPHDSAAAEPTRGRLSFVDGLAFVAESFLANPPRAGVPPGRREILIHAYPDASGIGALNLGRGLLETGEGLSAETVERLACDGATVKVTRGPRGEVLDLGRRTRRIGRSLGRALEVRDPCCRFPGCARRALLDAHHLVPWSAGGKTKLDNLARLCRTHHRLVHEGEWTIRRDEEGELEFRDAHGQRVKGHGRLPQVPAREAHAALEADCRERGLVRAPERLTALGGGEPVDDYGYATSVLADCCGFEVDPAQPDLIPPAVEWLQQHRESA